MENHIEARFHAAVSVLQKQLDAAKRGAANAELASLVSKVRLCQSIEQSLAHAQKGVPAALEQWEKLSALPAEIERIVRTRFDMAFNALQAGDGQYLAMLEKNRDLLSRSLLRFEILAGIESPAELSRERLQMQVEVLQSTLKAGPVTNKQKALLDLFRLAALTDEKTMGRIEQAIRKVAELH
jgi:exonuclease SbcC